MYYKSTGDMLSTFHRCLMAFCLIFGNNNCDTDVFSPIVPVVLGEKKNKTKKQTYFRIRYSI